MERKRPKRCGKVFFMNRFCHSNALTDFLIISQRGSTAGSDSRKDLASSQLISSRSAAFCRAFWVHMKSDCVEASRESEICPSLRSKLIASSFNGGKGSHILTRAGTTGVKNFCLFSLSRTGRSAFATLKHSLAIHSDLTMGYCLIK